MEEFGCMSPPDVEGGAALTPMSGGMLSGIALYCPVPVLPPIVGEAVAGFKATKLAALVPVGAVTA